MGSFRPRLAAGVGAAALLLSLGCAQRADEHSADVVTGRPADFAATPGYLTKVVDDSADESYRFEMSMAFGASRTRPRTHVPFVTGKFDGERTQMRMDLGGIAESMDADLDEDLPSGVTRDDFVIEAITDSDTMYVRAPFFRVLRAERPERDGGPAGFGELMEALAEGWISVDLAALEGVLPGQAAGTLAGEQNLDPRVFLDLVRATDSVEGLGSGRIDGVPVTGLAADVTFAEMMRVRGAEPTDLATTGLEALADVTVPIEVWIDGNGMIRRVGIDFDGEALMAAAAEAGEIPEDLGPLDGFAFTLTLDFSDYGDDSIDIAIPTDAVDMTETFVGMVRSLQELRNGLEGLENDIPAIGDIDIDVDTDVPTDAELDAALQELEEAYAEIESWEDIPDPPELPPMPEIPEISVPPPPPPMPELPEVPETPAG